MISLEVVAILLSGISISASIFYYANILNNANKARQTQLLMDLYQTYRSPEFFHDWDHVIWRIKADTWEEAMKSLHPLSSTEGRKAWFSVGTFFNGVGVLVKRNLIDISLVDDLLGNMIKIAWEKIGPIEVESRVRFNNPRAFEDFEYLYNEIVRVSEGRGSYKGLKNGFSFFEDIIKKP